MSPDAPNPDRPTAPSGPPPGGGAPRPPRRPRRRAPAWLAVVLLLLTAAGAWATWRLSPPRPDSVRTVTFDVRPGWGATRVARELESEGLIRDAGLFTLYLRVAGVDRAIGEGLYELGPAMSAPRIAAVLEAGGRPRIATVTVPEGWRARDVAERLEAAGVADADAVMELVREPGSLRPAWAPEDADLEGYLFPDTYQLRLDAGAERALTVMVDAFAERIGPELREALAGTGLSIHEWTILASMVQAEAAGPHEMPIIAGVFLNRLDDGMLLQSDPTVAYGLGKDLPALSAVDGDLRVDHPWNTYMRPGLPRGPIGNPGLDALRAVLRPERHTTDGERWMYFLHGIDDGEPVFRPNTTLAAHERDIDRFLR